MGLTFCVCGVTVTRAESDAGENGDEKIQDGDAAERPETDHGRCHWARCSGQGSWRNDENEREDGNTRKTLQAESTASAKVPRQEEAREHTSSEISDAGFCTLCAFFWKQSTAFDVF